MTHVRCCCTPNRGHPLSPNPTAWSGCPPVAPAPAEHRSMAGPCIEIRSEWCRQLLCARCCPLSSAYSQGVFSFRDGMTSSCSHCRVPMGTISLSSLSIRAAAKMLLLLGMSCPCPDMWTKVSLPFCVLRPASTSSLGLHPNLQVDLLPLLLCMIWNLCGY
jgi:hypothetical protein